MATTWTALTPRGGSSRSADQRRAPSLRPAHQRAGLRDVEALEDPGVAGDDPERAGRSGKSVDPADDGEGLDGGGRLVRVGVDDEDVLVVDDEVDRPPVVGHLAGPHVAPVVG